MQHVRLLWSLAMVTLMGVLFAGCDDSTLSPKNGDSVQRAATITLQPVDATVCSPQAVTFAIQVTGDPPPTIQWQFNPGPSWLDVNGATSATLVISPTAQGMNGYRYRAIVKNRYGTEYSTEAQLHIDCDGPAILTHPQNVAVCEGQPVTLYADASANPSPTIQWQQDAGTGFADIVGENQNALVIMSVPESMHNYRYRAVFTNVNGISTSQPATLTVHTAPTILLQPSDVTTTLGGNAIFQAVVKARPAAYYEWEWTSDAGQSWSDPSLSGANVSGVNSSTLTISNVTATLDGGQFRLTCSNTCGTVSTTLAQLSIL